MCGLVSSHRPSHLPDCGVCRGFSHLRRRSSVPSRRLEVSAFAWPLRSPCCGLLAPPRPHLTHGPRQKRKPRVYLVYIPKHPIEKHTPSPFLSFHSALVVALQHLRAANIGDTCVVPYRYR
jgi:hypothetical protein